MKKKLLIVLALIAVLLSLSAFAETGIFPLEKIGDYRKFATCYERIPPPRGPVIDMYYNFGIMDMDGNVVVEPIYEGISDFKDGRSLFKIGGKYGFFDENWNVVIEPKYKGAADFSEGLACVCDDNWSYGFIDVNGNTILPHTFDYAESFLNNGISVEQLAQAMQLGKLGEQIVLKSKFAFSKLKYEGFYMAEKDKYYVLRKARNDEANQFYFKMLEEESDGLFIQDIMRGGIKNDDARIPRNIFE